MGAQPVSANRPTLLAGLRPGAHTSIRDEHKPVASGAEKLTIRALRCTLGILSPAPPGNRVKTLPLHRRALVALVRHETQHLEQLRTVVYVARARGDGKPSTAHLGVRDPGSVGSSA